jgi:CheY-like chemotaxis protein
MRNPGEGRKPMILVVDDEAAVRTMLSWALKRHGFDVILAADGKEAVEVFRQLGREIDVVVLDLFMPNFSGIQTLAAIRAIDPQACCCFTTGDTGIQHEEDLLARGAAAVIGKPFVLADVVMVLWELAARDRS